ncbi:putative amidohydrolase [Deinococcus yavapaiensis KR-236]|uniref:Putative amidohydrolase n=1 Tax=Deinococcus yavapaiensis KR-236 TaxID=694435 RepID=A0A318SLU0_9DEIO|nr:putative amidohydrolase [Deinococcus yavapaiensis KR-236]
MRAVVVQPKWTVEDFASEGSFRAWMRSQLDRARPHLSSSRPNLVVLTELNGLPLLLTNARLATRATSLQGALALSLAKFLPEVLAVASARRVSLARALHLVRAPETVRVYLETCRDLARTFGVYLVSGSAPLPHLARIGTDLSFGSQVFNETVIFAPDGRVIGTADKVYLTQPEGPGGLDFSVGRLEDLRVFPTDVGDLGVAISLDAFMPDVIARLEEQGCTVLLQPDANGGSWTGKEQEGPRTGERDQPEAWLESAWQAVQRSPTLRYALNPMVVGNLFDVAFDGQSAIVARSDEAAEPRSYVMTEPRAGFLALAPWVEDGDLGTLRRVGLQLEPASRSPRENAYREDVLSADLTLPPRERDAQPLSPHEEAVNALLEGRAVLSPAPGVTAARSVKPFVVASLVVGGARIARRSKLVGGALVLAGAALGALWSF